MTWEPKVGGRALMQVDVVGTEYCEDSGATSLIVECPNGERTVAADGQLRPHVSAEELGAIARLMRNAAEYIWEGGLAENLAQAIETDLARLVPLRTRMGW